MYKIFIFLLLTLPLASCTSHKPTSPEALAKAKAKLQKQQAERALFLAIEQLPFQAVSEEFHAGLFDLPKYEQDAFLRYFRADQQIDIDEYYRVYQYVQDNIGHYTYYGDTYTAQESFENKAGNCLSLAILSVAYAKLVDVEVKFDLVSSSPVYLQEQNVDLVSNHVRTKLLAQKPKDGNYYIGRDGAIIDYFPVRNSRIENSINEEHFISLYYQNLAAEELKKENYEKAINIAKAGFLISPNNLHLANIIAVSFVKQHQYSKGEDIYDLALAVDPDDLQLLSNSLILANKVGNKRKADQLSVKIDNSKDPSPFRWLEMGNLAFEQQDIEKALRYFKRARKIAPYLSQAHQGVGKSLYLLGDLDGAEKSFQLALQNTHNDYLEQLYQAKLNVLSQQKER